MKLFLRYHKMSVRSGVLILVLFESPFSTCQSEWGREEAKRIGHVVTIEEPMIKVREVVFRLMQPVL